MSASLELRSKSLNRLASMGVVLAVSGCCSSDRSIVAAAADTELRHSAVMMSIAGTAQSASRSNARRKMKLGTDRACV